MLGKLLKYEFKATSRILIPLYLILLITTGMNRLILLLDIFEGSLMIIPVIMKTLFILSVITIFITAFILMIYRFYKNLLSDEGYLMFTLPAKTHQLIISKYLATLTWLLVSIIIIIGSAVLAIGTPENIKLVLNNLNEFLLQFEASGNNTTVTIITLLLFCLTSFITYISLIYASIAIGQLFTKNRLVGAFVSYIGISTLMQLLLLLLLVMTNVFRSIITNGNNMIPLKLLLGIIVYQIVVSIIFFITTNRIFQKKLNLE
ncbi:hypothetical protein GCM10023142_01860 [Anaerocolumna aminovalerica]|uniref:ABC-2 family transporter protein n=1 Tax=Anaerocolumna aminovalerica TaxID=1527 RepID=A0A1I5BJD8_9FIRM|nr:hypothetical protein [Anaerocolumna aminovalerica]MDU6265763.1 hypothetical protein [Anaerocolumna aminovalerica]SFN74854.1 hypothetical protein SAMN04489757_10144 [Anaerocolumna aminovalerica]